MGEKNDRTVRMRPEDLPDPAATRIADPDATRAAATRVAARVPAVDAPVTMFRVYWMCPGVSAMMKERLSVAK